LELNTHANKLLFRDKRRQLYLYNIRTSQKNTLLSYCNYAQWVPDSEVIVAQNRNNLCVWYSIENPDKVTLYTIKGDVEEIERTPGKTEVIVNEGNGNTVAYQLDEPLIEFGFAVESRDLEKAAAILDPLDMSPDTEANWKVLAQIALDEQTLTVSEHCYAALGDLARAAYLRKINKVIYKYEQETGKKDGLQYYKV
jgi:intraflagellar transport protein 172